MRNKYVRGDFKKGDTVQRTQDHHHSMSPGDKDKIIEISGLIMDLEKFGEGHDPRNFKLITITLRDLIK